MPVLEGKIIRLACNQSSAGGLVDVLTGERVVVWQGAQAKIQCALFVDDPSAATYVTDLSNITSIELIVRKHNQRGAVLLDKVLLPSDLTVSTYAAWVAGTGQQFTFVLPDTDTSWDVMAAGELPLYLTVLVLTTTAGYVAGQGFATLEDVGIVDIIAPIPPSGFTLVTPILVGSTNVQVFRGFANVRIVASAGAGAYTYKLILLLTGATSGSEVDVDIELPASANPTIEVRNATASGTLLYSITSDSDNTTLLRVTFKYTGTAWMRFGPPVT